MDSERFDGLVRRFGQTQSRRQALRGLAGAVAVGAFAVGGREASAARCKSDGKACKKNSQCCSGNCGVGTGQKPLPGVCAPACGGGCSPNNGVDCPTGCVCSNIQPPHYDGTCVAAT